MILQKKTTKNTIKNGQWPDHPYRILIIGCSGSEKINALLNLIKEEDDIGKIYLYAKDLCEPNYKFLIKNMKMQE